MGIIHWIDGANKIGSKKKIIVNVIYKIKVLLFQWYSIKSKENSPNNHDVFLFCWRYNISKQVIFLRLIFW